MPTYQYACANCGHEFEVFQSFTEDSLNECPECKGEVKKVYSAVGVVFKGSGFYKTDSAKSSTASVPAPAPTPAPAPKAD
jgi:putative FmdB family regulatory protein